MAADQTLTKFVQIYGGVSMVVHTVHGTATVGQGACVCGRLSQVFVLEHYAILLSNGVKSWRALYDAELWALIDEVHAFW